MPQDERRALLETLTRELFQTETSAALHCQREADRLGDADPARVMRAVSADATRVLEALPAIAERHDLPVSAAGVALGSLFSETRERIADHFIDAERSYRGTLLGMRHGMDAVRLFRHVAALSGLTELVSFADTWLQTRGPLVDDAAEQLIWFATHAERAREKARSLLDLAGLRHA